MQQRTVLIIDDEETLRGLLAKIIELEGYHVLQSATAREGLRMLQKEQVQVVITDVRLADAHGVELTAKIKTEYPAIEVIVLTAFGTIADGVQAMKNGAFDYLTKGAHQEKIIPLLSKAAEKALLQQKVSSLESQLQRKFGFENIIGNAAAMKAAVDLARKVATSDTNVLLLGETGTGKEVFAQAIHHEGARRSKSLVALNCSAFPKDLLESELFGHAEGAFTGASRAKKGLIEEAHEGTLFLDEIGETPIDLQAKLLRVVETHEFYRVGDTRARHADIRVIAATNRNLEAEVDAGRFRQDLFYRLSVFIIKLPSLRERKEDIKQLAEHFTREFANKTNKRRLGIQTAFIKSLELHPWNGNIRELKNVIERCVIMADGEELSSDLLPGDFNVDESEDSQAIQTVEKKHIQKVLKLSAGNKTQAAKLLGIGLTTLYQKIKDYDL